MFYSYKISLSTLILLLVSLAIVVTPQETPIVSSTITETATPVVTATPAVTETTPTVTETLPTASVDAVAPTPSFAVDSPYTQGEGARPGFPGHHGDGDRFKGLPADHPFRQRFNGTRRFRPHFDGSRPFPPHFNGSHPFPPYFDGSRPFPPHFNGSRPFPPHFNGSRPFPHRFNGSRPFPHHGENGEFRKPEFMDATTPLPNLEAAGPMVEPTPVTPVAIPDPAPTAVAPQQ